MDDLIERAEAELESIEYAIQHWRNSMPGDDAATSHLIEVVEDFMEIPLVAALKAAHKEIDWLHGEIDRMRVRGDY